MPDPLPVHPAALPKGHLLADYEIVRVLGAGGFGITYLAFDHQLDGPVAIKEYFPAELAVRADGDQVAATAPTSRAGLVSDKSRPEIFAWGLERFLDEARAVHRFRHPNVVRAHRYLEANGTAYLVMEYVEGESLKSILDRRGSLPAAEWRPRMDSLLEGLEHVHSHGYLHRDIKPANVVIRSEDGEPVLIDFGSARLQHRDRTHTQVLSAAYAPIEQHSTGGATQGPPTDIYALAATTYRALTGARLSSAPDRILNDDYEPLADRIGGTDGRWLTAIDHGLAVRPENRPQTVEEWRSELDAEAGAALPNLSTGLPETAEPTIRAGTQPTRDSLVTPPRLARLRPAVAALGALLLFGAVLSVVSLTRGPSREFRLGEKHYYGDGTAQDYGAAIESYRKAADQGHAAAQFSLGFMYFHGQGVPQDYGEAAAWYRKAADQGHAGAQSNLGWLYRLGDRLGGDLPEDKAESAAWYRRAADQGYVATERKRADQGDAQAQFRLAFMYESGQNVPVDYGEAAAWYRKAADQGHALAQFNLGEMYVWGRGVPQDAREGKAWFRKAADQGYAEAQFEVGRAYDHGEGMRRDDEEAAVWYRKAADQGHVDAQVHLGDLYRLGQGVPEDDEQAVAWFRKAADQGDYHAPYLLGNMYSRGEGVPQDDIQAYAWWNIAAGRGSWPAEREQDRHGGQMTREQIAEALRLSADLAPE